MIHDPDPVAKSAARPRHFERENPVMQGVCSAWVSPVSRACSLPWDAEFTATTRTACTTVLDFGSRDLDVVTLWAGQTKDFSRSKDSSREFTVLCLRNHAADPLVAPTRRALMKATKSSSVNRTREPTLTQGRAPAIRWRSTEASEILRNFAASFLVLNCWSMVNMLHSM